MAEPTYREAMQAYRQSLADQLKTSIAAGQKNCKHAHVGHCAMNGDYPRRICLECGIEEVGSWWSYSGESCWSRKEFDGQPILGGLIGKPTAERTVVELEYDEFFKARI